MLGFLKFDKTKWDRPLTADMKRKCQNKGVGQKGTKPRADTREGRKCARYIRRK